MLVALTMSSLVAVLTRSGASPLLGDIPIPPGGRTPIHSFTTTLVLAPALGTHGACEGTWTQTMDSDAGAGLGQEVMSSNLQQTAGLPA